MLLGLDCARCDFVVDALLLTDSPLLFLCGACDLAAAVVVDDVVTLTPSGDADRMSVLAAKREKQRVKKK
jgi:hypothetical protein